MQTDTKSNRSQTSTWLQTAAIIIIPLISIAVTTFLSVRAQQSKGITLWTVTSRSLLTTEVRANLTIRFNETSVELPWVYTVRLTNTGSLPIESRDVEKPLTMTFTDSRIVHAEITTKEPHDVEANAIHSSDELTLHHGLLNQGDWFEVDVLFDGQPPQPVLSYRVTGLNTPPQITEFQSAEDKAFIPWLPEPARYFVVTIASLCVVAFFIIAIALLKDLIVSLIHPQRPLNRLLSELASGEIPESLRHRVARQASRALPSQLDSEVQAIIENLSSNDLCNDPNVLADQILNRLPDELKELMQTNKEILVRNLNLKEALAQEVWVKLPSPLDAQVRKAIISAPFDANSASPDEMQSSIREALSKISRGRRIDRSDVVMVFVLFFFGACLAIVTTDYWNLLL